MVSCRFFEMHHEDSTNGGPVSVPEFFEVRSVPGLATVALGASILTKEAAVWMITVLTLYF